MTEFQFESSEEFAKKLDEQDPLADLRDRFDLPCDLYFCGNSLGPHPKKAKDYVNEELDDWAKLGVRGHLEARHPWLPYHEFLTEPMSRVVGALPSETVVMNTLTVNLHVMMTSFYRPNSDRYKILIEGGAFPSDQYAVASQAKLHGFSPKEAIIELTPRQGEETLRDSDILETIDKNGSEIALVLLGNVNYLTGQAFQIDEITKLARKKGARVGFDLAHGAGNLELRLHDDAPDFAVWCNYKYLNGGAGCVAGCFVSEKHARNFDLPRLAGWWGHDNETRFKMPKEFSPLSGAEGWQLSNPPILPLAALRASLEVFEEASMSRLTDKSRHLTSYFEYLLGQLPDGFCQVVTPASRGAQLSIRFGTARDWVEKLSDHDVIVDFRQPDIIRATPAPLYIRYVDVYRFYRILSEISRGSL